MKHLPYLLMLLGTSLLFCSFAATAQLVVQWDKTLGGLQDDQLEEVVATPDGGYLLVGYSSSIISGEKTEYPIGGCDDEGKCDVDFWLVKIDGDGNKQWDKVIGIKNRDTPVAVIALPDGGYLLGGNTSTANSEYWLMKIDENGNKFWEESYGGGGQEWLTSVTSTPDGGYLLAGTSLSKATKDKSEPSRGRTDFWVVKIDANGKQQWDKTLGGDNYEYTPYAIATHDGGYLVSGGSDSDASGDKSQDRIGGDRTRDYWVIKLDENGNKLWDKSYGNPERQFFHNIVATTDGNYLLTGYTHTPTGYLIIKIDVDGNQLWMKSYGDHNVVLRGAIATDDGNSLLFGWMSGDASGESSEASRGRADYWALKIDSDGNRLWDEAIGGNWDDEPSDVINTPDGGYLLAGDSRSDAIADKTDVRRGGHDYWVVKVVEGDDEEKESLGVGGFSLVKVNEFREDEVLHSLVDGMEVNLFDIGTSLLSVRAVPHPLLVDKVVFELSGPVTRTQTENNWPYTLFGDQKNSYSGETIYHGWEMVPGDYSLKATAYMDGKAGRPLQISFTIIDEPPAVVSAFILVNADTDQDIKRLREGDVVDISALGNPQLSIRANTDPFKIDRIEISLSGPLDHTQTESGWPYALFGDRSGPPRDYVGRSLPSGNYTLRATPFLNSKEGTESILHFSVTGGSSNQARVAAEVYPVPTTGMLTIEGIKEQASISVLDFYGNEVMVLPFNTHGHSVGQLDLGYLKKGIYYMKIMSPGNVEVKRIVLE